MSTGLFLPVVQSNSIASSINHAFEVPVGYTGAMVTLFLALVIAGGVKRIGKVAEIMVPFMAVAYVLMALVIIGLNITKVPEVFSLIFKSAFAIDPIFGGIFGMAIAMGVKRGIYSNEAGQGTGPHAAAAAEVSHPVKQGLVQAFSVYVDTLFICTATALMILFTGTYNVENGSQGYIVEYVKGVEKGPEFTQMAVSAEFPMIGSGFVAIALLFFAFTTLMAYYYIAETNLSFLNRKPGKTYLIWGLRILLLGATFYGSISQANHTWAMGDIGVGTMAWLNVIAILLLRKPAMKCWRDYKKQRKAGLDPVFKAKEAGIENADEWN